MKICLFIGSAINAYSLIVLTSETHIIFVSETMKLYICVYYLIWPGKNSTI